MPELDQRIIDILEDNDWTIHEITETGDTGRFSYYVEIETYSYLGEDFIETIYFDGTNEGFIDGIEEDYEDFDPEEHATMWYETHGKNGAPTSLRALLEDADDLDSKLEELCLKLNKLDFDYEEN